MWYKMKRFLSLLLVLCLLLAEFPLSAFAVGESSSAGNSGSETDNSGTSLTATGDSGYKVIYDWDRNLKYKDQVAAVTYANSLGFWEYYADTVYDGDSATNERFIINTNYGITSAGGSPNDWIALKIYVPVAGDYKMTQEYTSRYNGGTFSAYILPGSTAVADITDALDGATALGSFDCWASAETKSSVDFGTVNFTQAGEYLYVLKTTGRNSSSTNSGRYIYLGNTTLDGGSKLTAMKLMPTLSASQAKEGDKVQISVAAYNSDGTACTPSYTYTSLTPAIATVDATGLVSTLTPGTAKIKVSATVEGITQSAEVEFTVSSMAASGYRVIYDWDRNLKYKDQVATVTYEESFGFWAYYADTVYDGAAATNTSFIINPNYGIVSTGGSPNEWVALKIHVPAAGDYKMTQDYTSRYNGGIYSAYILPGSTAVADITDALNGATALGSFDCWASTETKSTASFGTVTFDAAGDYLYVLKTTGRNSSSTNSGRYLYLGNTTLDGGDGLAVMSMQVSVSKTELKVSDKLQISANVYLSDGTASTTTPCTFESLTPTVASVDATGVVTGVASGTARIKVSNGSAEETVELTIVPMVASGVKVVYQWSRFQKYKDPVFYINYEDTKGFWEYYADSVFGSLSNKDERFIIHTDYGIQSMNGNVGQWVALKIYVPEAGDYQMTQEFRARNNAGTYDVFILPGNTAAEDIGTAVAQTVKTGSIDGYTDSSSVVPATTNFGVVSFAEAGEYLLVFKLTDNSHGCYLYLGTTTLTGGEELSPMQLQTSIPANSLKETDKLQISASTYLSDGTLSNATYTYTSLTPATASVDATGVITGIAAGPARIRVSVTIAGKTLENEVELTIVPLSASGSKLVYNWSRFQKYKDPVFYIDYEDTKGFWEYYADNIFADISNKDERFIIHTNYGIQSMNGRVGQWIALKIYVPEAGDYQMTQEFRARNNAGTYDVFILPGNTAAEDIGTAVAQTVKTGSIDGYTDSSSVVPATTNFGVVSFAEAGEYLLVFKLTDNSHGCYLYLGTTTLTGGDDLELMHLEASVKKSELKETDTLSIDAGAYLSDGSLWTGALTYRSLTPAIASVDAKGVITGVAAGDAQIEISAAVDGRTLKKVVTLKVLPLSASGIQVIYDYTENLSYKDPVRNVTFADTYNFWSYYDSSMYTNVEDVDTRFIIHPTYGIQSGTGTFGKWVGIKLNVPKAGDYKVSQSVWGRYNGGVYDVYLLPGDTAPEDVDTALSQAVALGSIDCYSKTTQNVVVDFGIVNFAQAGEYLLIFKSVSRTEGSSGSYLYTDKTILYGGEGTVVMETDISTKESLKTGETAQIKPTIYLSDGTVANVVYQYASLNENAVVNRTGLITAIKEGEAQIKITAVLPNGTHEMTLVLPITTTKPSGVQVTYNMLYGMAMYDDVRLIGYEDTLNNNWMYYADGAAHRSLDIHTSYGIRFQNAGSTHYLALKIKVPAAGDYLMTQTHGIYKDGGISTVHILPGDTPAEDILEAIKTTPAVNEVNFYNPTLAKTKTVLGYVSFDEPGEYIVVYKPDRVPEGGRTWHIYLGDIYLDGLNCLKSVTPAEENISLTYGQTYKSEFVLRKLDGTVVDPADCTITFRSSDAQIATVDDNGVVTAVGHGTAQIEITAYDGVETHSGTFTVNAVDNTGVKGVYIDLDSGLYVRETALVNLVLTMNSGNKVRLSGSELEITVSDGNLLSVLDGTVTANAEGTATIKVVGYFLGEKVSAEHTVTITTHPGKTEPTYYTYDMRNNILLNVVQYDWARSERDNVAKAGREALRIWENVYDLIMQENLPRSRQVGYQTAANYGYCRYCGANVTGIYGASGVGGWNIDPIDHPWKVQCKDCLRWFPSNDFGSFYELGLDENGVFDYDKAWAENEKLIASGHSGYLVNELYPEMGEGWGVDDGWGARVHKDGTKMTKLDISLDSSGNPKSVLNDNIDSEQSAVYIALYIYMFWQYVEDTVVDLAKAYTYTGNIEYGRAGAILLDRVADTMPGYDLNTHFYNADWMVTDGGAGYGLWQGRIDDCTAVGNYAEAADMLFPALNDPQVIRRLSAKAEEFNLENDKTSSQKIWQNWRDNLLLEAWEAFADGRIHGNFGQAQQAVAKAAIVLAEEPETTEIISWLYTTDTLNSNRLVNGGDLNLHLINTLDRNGISNEGSPNYNTFQARQLTLVADTLALYTGEGDYNLYENPKFAQMFVGFPAMILSDSHIAQIGDSGAVASLDFLINNTMYIAAFQNLKDTPVGKRIAQTIYIMNGGSVSDLHYGITSADPERLRYEIMDYVDIHEDKFSEMITGRGYAVLRDGFLSDQESMQSAWMYFGGCVTSHGHYDVLNMGIEAFGLNLTPDLGYPTNTGSGDPTRSGWVAATISHNTVVVNEQNQDRVSTATTPLLFDDSEYVQVMGVDGSDAYPQVDEYNRTVVQIKIDDDDSYYLDFFRVLGGTHHTYSIHAQSQGAMPMSGLDLELQTDENGNMVGTYAGPDVEYGASGDFPLGYNYMTKVRRDTDPESNKFVVDFTITDYRGAVSNNKDIHLQMTQINNFTPDEVAIVGGLVPIKKDNAAITEETDTLEYVLTQRESANGEELDSLFTTVFEPYKKTSNLVSIDQIPVEAVAGKPGSTDVAVAVKVTHKSGRVDYVFYSSNNTVTYCVDDTFEVRGYVGVYSLDGSKGIEIYRYVTGGDIIVEATETVGTYKGTVLGFSTELTMYDNYIDVNLDGSVAEDLAGRFIFVENDGVQNGVYKIESAKAIDGGVRLNLGTVSLIRSLRDSTNLDAGYIYNIAKGQRFEINMAYTKCDLSTNTNLMFLELNGASLTPDFDPEEYDYTAFVDATTRMIDIRAFTADPNATVKIQSGSTVYNDSVAEEVTIGTGKNTLKVTVIAEDGMTSRTYWITVTRADHFCYGGIAYCDETAVCVECGSHYGYIDPDNHRTVELWNGKYATKDSDGYSGDYYCVECHLLATKGHVLVYQSPVNIGLILLIAAGVLLVGGGATVTAILVLKNRKKAPADAETSEDQQA